MSDNEYMPTTEHVRAQYARQENYDEFYEGDLYDTSDGQVSAAEFDRWLAAHDREVAAKALTDAADEFSEKSASTTEETMPSGNRYVTTEAWLRARAAALGVPVSPENEGKK